MILKGSQRGGAAQLGLHLMNTETNDQVEVFEIRGFVGTNLVDALREAYAVSRGTRCDKFLYSLSLSPPQGKIVSVATFENAINEIEKTLGLKGHARVIVFHEKEGRRHAHCVWSRINPKTLTAQPISHDRLKLREISRRLYLQHGWKPPKGLVNEEEANPLNYSRAEWREAMRARRDPLKIKKVIKDCWAISDSLSAFQGSLEERGYFLAKGDRRGHVIIDCRGDVFSLSRWLEKGAAELRAKLGHSDELESVETVQAKISEKVSSKVDGFVAEVRAEFENAINGLAVKKKLLVSRHRDERNRLSMTQRERRQAEAIQRALRFRRGILGLWDRIVGKAAQIRRANEIELEKSLARDAEEHQRMVARQLAERQELQKLIKAQSDMREKEIEVLGRSLQLNDVPLKNQNTPTRTRTWQRIHDRGPKP